MKRFGPFSLVRCLLIALGFLFSGCGVLGAGKTLSLRIAVDEEALKDVEDLIPVAGLRSFFVSCFFFCRQELSLLFFKNKVKGES
jgi:hypothetical protein